MYKVKYELRWTIILRVLYINMLLYKLSTSEIVTIFVIILGSSSKANLPSPHSIKFSPILSYILFPFSEVQFLSRFLRLTWI